MFQQLRTIFLNSEPRLCPGFLLGKFGSSLDFFGLSIGLSLATKDSNDILLGPDVPSEILDVDVVNANQLYIFRSIISEHFYNIKDASL